jgi:hypothetical protein
MSGGPETVASPHAFGALVYPIGMTMKMSVGKTPGKSSEQGFRLEKRLLFLYKGIVIPNRM